jgi:hypothetical protein
MRNVVRTIPEPATIAASSKDGSMERKAAASKRKASGIWSTPKTQIIPNMLLISRGCSNPRYWVATILTIPVRRLNKMIQPTVVRSPGTTIGTKTIA